MLGASGLLAGLGGGGRGCDPNRNVDGFERRNRREFDGQFAASSARGAPKPPRGRPSRRVEGPDAACADLERLPDVGDHSDRHCRAAGDLVVHDPKSKAGGTGENGPSVGPDRVRLAGGAFAGRSRSTTKTAFASWGWGARLWRWLRAPLRGTAARSQVGVVCVIATGGDRRGLLQPPLRHPRRRTERARRQPGRSPCGDDPRAGA